MMKRGMSVAGAFYPGRAVEIERYFEHFNAMYDENFQLPHPANVKAVIVPHAGYVYSGFTASIAYRVLQQSGIKNFVVIGPSHKVGFNGVSLCDFESYDTPFGEIPQAAALAQSLKEKFYLSCVNQAHQEHSTEVQFPFIKHYLEDVSIVELVYSNIDAGSISEIIDFILTQKDCGVIISTDLSHFYSLENANQLDNLCITAIESLNLNLLHAGCEACGMIGVEAMMRSAKKLDLTPNILDYRTSADASGDEERVVGYMSAYFS